MCTSPPPGARADAAQQALVGLGHLLQTDGGMGIGPAGRDQTRGRLRVQRAQRPAALGAAHQIQGGHMQAAPTHRFDALQGVQVAGMALHQGSG